MRVLVVFLMSVLAMLGACASAPPRLVALPAAPDTTGIAAADREAAPAILVRRVTVPGYLDGFPVVTGRQGETVVVAPDAEWAERLSDGAARVLRAALSQRLAPGSVLIEGDGRIPDADLTVEFLALDPQGDRLVLDARWSFVGMGERASRSGRTRLDAPLIAPDASPVAAATAAALGRFADVLAAEAVRMQGADAGERGAR